MAKGAPQVQGEQGAKKKGSWGPTLLILLAVGLAAFLFFKKEITGWVSERLDDFSVVQTLADPESAGDIQ